MLNRIISLVSRAKAPPVRDVELITLQTALIMLYKREMDVILDVRRREEYEKGHIPGAVCVPQEEALAKINGLAISRNSRILIYCATHVRSSRVSAFLTAIGYTNVFVLRGGIIQWRSASLPVEACDPL